MARAEDRGPAPRVVQTIEFGDLRENWYRGPVLDDRGRTLRLCKCGMAWAGTENCRVCGGKAQLVRFPTLVKWMNTMRRL